MQQKKKSIKTRDHNNEFRALNNATELLSYNNAN